MHVVVASLIQLIKPFSITHFKVQSETKNPNILEDIRFSDDGVLAFFRS